jgi:hypothetical protein
MQGADEHAMHEQHMQGTTEPHAAQPAQAHTGHGPAMTAAAPVDPPAATASAAKLRQTLRPDSLDAPVPTAVQDAAKVTSMAGMAHEGHAAHGTYVQVDAGREASAADPHAGHQMAPSPRPSPTPNPHREHH